MNDASFPEYINAYVNFRKLMAEDIAAGKLRELMGVGGKELDKDEAWMYFALKRRIMNMITEEEKELIKRELEEGKDGRQ